MTKRIIGVLLALMVLMVSATPSVAWNQSGAKWAKGTTANYCFGGGFSETAKNNMADAIERIDAEASALTLNRASAFCDVDIRTENNEVMPPARAAKASGVIYVNFHYNFWIYGSNNQCIQWYAGFCGPDLFSVISHEFMHVMGLEHPGYPGANIGSCSYGYYWTWQAQEVSGLCDQYGDRVMWAAAADGYRRWLSSDDRGGISALYDW